MQNPQIMKLKLIYTIILFALATVSLSAQQEPNYTFYRYNMNLINPAYAGANEGTDLGLNVRSQWASVEGAPETQSVIFGTPLRKNVGIGASIINDRTFIENQTSIALDFSYKLKLNEKHDLFFGIKAGFNSYKANTAGLMTYGIQADPSLMNIDGSFNVNIGIGAYLKNDKYFLALSIPRVLTPDRLEFDNGLAKIGMDKMHVYLAGGYDIALADKIVLKPTVLLSYVEASPLSLDVTTLVEFNNRFDIGVGYRLDESISGILIFKASKWMDIGYAYEAAFESPVRTIDNGTHEILLNLKL